MQLPSHMADSSGMQTPSPFCSAHLQSLALIPLCGQLRQQLLVASLRLHALGTRRRRHLVRLPLQQGALHLLVLQLLLQLLVARVGVCQLHRCIVDVALQAGGWGWEARWLFGTVVAACNVCGEGPVWQHAGGISGWQQLHEYGHPTLSVPPAACRWSRAPPAAGCSARWPPPAGWPPSGLAPAEKGRQRARPAGGELGMYPGCRRELLQLQLRLHTCRAS